MPVCDIEYQRIGTGINERLGTFEVIAANPDCCGHRQSTAIVFGGIGPLLSCGGLNLLPLS